jgi:hypothetical protein
VRAQQHLDASASDRALSELLSGISGRVHRASSTAIGRLRLALAQQSRVPYAPAFAHAGGAAPGQQRLHVDRALRLQARSSGGGGGDDARGDAPRPPDLGADAPLRRLLPKRLRRDDPRVTNSIAGRLRSLGDDPVEFAPRDDDAVAHDTHSARVSRGEIEFTAGPRSGERISLERRTVALDADAMEAADSSATNVVASIWAQGSRFMLRHNGAVSINAARLSMPVVTLEDGDELAWGAHRLRIRIESTTDNRG